MFSIFFKCPGCQAHMSAEDNDVGWQFNCPKCNAGITVPSGDIIFTCGYCNKSMMAAATMVGEEFNCPDCKCRVAIPRPEKVLAIPEKPLQPQQPAEPEKKTVTKLALPPELQQRLARKKSLPAAEADKRVNDYLLMTWGPDALAAATPDDNKKKNQGAQQ